MEYYFWYIDHDGDTGILKKRTSMTKESPRVVIEFIGSEYIAEEGFIEGWTLIPVLTPLAIIKANEANDETLS